MEKIAITLNLIAGLLALISWDSKSIHKTLMLTHLRTRAAFNKYKRIFWSALGFLVLFDVVSFMFGLASFFADVFVGTGEMLGIAAGSLTIIYVLVSFSVWVVYFLFVILEKTLGFMASGNVKRKWVTAIALLFVASSVIQLVISS
jgi:hypothetical protein